jgi:hypothetical protein
MTDAEYPPLPENSIRLLDVSRPEGQSDPVCSFRVVSLDNPPKYRAISYCWGDTTEVTRINFHDGRSLPLSETLAALFASLLEKRSSFTVWIDALCINQPNMSEREAQVLMMGRIFSSAVRVLLWLGGSDAISARAFPAMRAVAKDDKERDQDALESIFLLLRRPWFQRVWVIQEITVGARVTMACGDDTLPFDLFANAVFAVWGFFTGLLDYEDTDPAQRGLWCVTRLIHIRWEFQERAWEEGASGVCYETLLQAAFHCNATDRRDMVFAFRGIADGRPVPRPNYGVSEEQLFVETAEALLCNGDSLDLLALCGIGNRDGELLPELPSWVPDLRTYSYNEPLVPCNSSDWTAGGPLEVSPFVETEPLLRLRLQAKLIDEVAVVSPEFTSWSVEGQQKAMQVVWDWRRRISSPISDEAWMERVMSTLIVGIDIDDEPLVTGTPLWEEYKSEFSEWLDWLWSSSSEEDLEKITHNRYHRTIGPCIDEHVACMTSQGMLCVGMGATVAGDVVCTVPGCRIPLIMRREEVTSSWRLIGWCFADGLMFGEAATLERPIEEILLR